MTSQFSNVFHVVFAVLSFRGITYHISQLTEYSHILPPFSRGVTVIISSVKHTTICLPGWNETLLHKYLFPTAMNFPSISLDWIASITLLWNYWKSRQIFSLILNLISSCCREIQTACHLSYPKLNSWRAAIIFQWTVLSFARLLRNPSVNEPHVYMLQLCFPTKSHIVQILLLSWSTIFIFYHKLKHRRPPLNVNKHFFTVRVCPVSRQDRVYFFTLAVRRQSLEACGHF